MQYDSNADGYIDKETSHVGTGFGDQVQLKLERTSGEYSERLLALKTSANDGMAGCRYHGNADRCGRSRLDAGATSPIEQQCRRGHRGLQRHCVRFADCCCRFMPAKGPEATIAKRQTLAQDVTVTRYAHQWQGTCTGAR